jgi:hypothetical protein
MHLLRRGSERGARRMQRLLAYGCAAAVTAGVPYLLVLPWVAGGSPTGLVNYVRPSYSAGDYLTSPMAGAGRALQHLEGLVLAAPHTGAGGGMTLLWWILRAALVGLLAWLLVRRGRQDLTPAAGRLRRGALWSLAAFVPLWTVWDAGNWEFLLLALPALAVLLALAVHRRTAHGGGRAVVTAGLAAAALTLGAYQFANVIEPQADPRNNPSWVRSQFIRHHSGPRDIILISGVGDYRAEKFYLRYLGRRRLVLQWKLLQMDAADVPARLRADLQREWSRGARLLATSDVFDDANLQLLEADYGFGRADLERALSGLNRRALAALEEGFTIWELAPPATERSEEE